jgi:thioredoxin-like negative regulator of GroEL
METLHEDFEDKITWVSVNTREDPNNFAQKFGVSVVPTVVVTKGTQVVGVHSGANVGIYYALIRKGLAST